MNGLNVRTYKQLSPDNQQIADQVTQFTYDLLDLWDKTIKAKIEPQHLQFWTMYTEDQYDEIISASWVLKYSQGDTGEWGGAELNIEIRYLNDPKYRHGLFIQIVTSYARLVYGSEGTER